MVRPFASFTSHLGPLFLSRVYRSPRKIEPCVVQNKQSKLCFNLILQLKKKHKCEIRTKSPAHVSRGLYEMNRLGEGRLKDLNTLDGGLRKPEQRQSVTVFCAYS